MKLMARRSEGAHAGGPYGSLLEMRRFWFLTTLPLAASLAVMWLSAKLESQTFDEGVYLAGGYSYLTTGDYRLNPEHPPLSKLLFGLPLLFLRPDLPTGHESWQLLKLWDQYEFAQEFLYRNRVPADSMLLAGRTVNMVLTLALGVAVCWWTWRHFNAGAALAALIIFCFEPTVLAHGRYATPDMAVTLTMFLACILWGRYLLSRRPRLLAASGVLFGLALATKFAAFALVPIFALLYLVRRWQERGTRADATAPPLPALNFRHWFAATAKMSVVAAVVIFATYGFELRTPLSDSFTARQLEKSFDEVRSDRRVMPALAWALNPDNAAGRTVRWLGSHVPVPAYSYVKGLYVQVAHSRTGHPTYLLGRFSQHGGWLYFPVAFLVKTPFFLLLLLILASFLCATEAARRPVLSRLRSLPFSWYQILVPIVVYFCLSQLSTVKTGIRYLLPVYPFLIVGVSAVLFAADRSRVRRSLYCILLAALVVESARIYPHYLAFFNFAAGGPVNGPRYLVDSNIDWGQDLKKLKKYLDSEDAGEVCLRYFGTAEPAYYGIRSLSLPVTEDLEGRANMNCLAAISVTFLQELYLPRGSYEWLRQLDPVERIGFSIYVYDFRKRPAAAE